MFYHFLPPLNDQGNAAYKYYTSCISLSASCIICAMYDVRWCWMNKHHTIPYHNYFVRIYCLIPIAPIRYTRRCSAPTPAYRPSTYCDHVSLNSPATEHSLTTFNYSRTPDERPPSPAPSLNTTTYRVTDSGFWWYMNPSRAAIPLIRPHQCDYEGGRIRGVLLYLQSRLACLRQRRVVGGKVWKWKLDFSGLSTYIRPT